MKVVKSEYLEDGPPVVNARDLATLNQEGPPPADNSEVPPADSPEGPPPADSPEGPPSADNLQGQPAAEVNPEDLYTY